MISRQLLLSSIRQLVTLSGPARLRTGKEMGEIGVIEDAALVANDGVIVWVGRQRDLDRSILTDPHEVDCRRSVVLPGLIDCHTHAMFAGSREDEFALRARGATYQEIAAAGGGIVSTVRATRAATKKELKKSTSRHLDRMMHHGTTSVEIKTGYGLTHDDEVKMLEGLRELALEHVVSVEPTFLGAHAVPPEAAGDAESYLSALIGETIPYIARRKLARTADVFCEKGYYSVEQSRRYLTAARDHGFRLRLHADQLNDIGASRLGAELGAVTVDHLETVSDEAIALLRDAGTMAVLLPGASFFLGGVYAPARRLIDAGVPVALSTNFNPGSCMSYSLPLMMTIACTQMHMTPEECLTAVTLHPAYALGIERVAGSVETGKSADLAIFDVPSYRTIAYHFGENHVSHVVKRGVLYETRE